MQGTNTQVLPAGELSSDDDFYLLDTGLTVLQTTNDILDESLYDLLTPHSLTSWQRVPPPAAAATAAAARNLLPNMAD